MSGCDSANNENAVLAFPMTIATHSLDATKVVVDAELGAGTLALLSGRHDVEVTIGTPEAYAEAANELAKIKAVAKKIEEDRKVVTAPLDAEKKRVMDYVRPFSDALTRAESTLKNALIAYDRKQEEKRQLAAAAEAERARKEQARLETRADKAEASGKTEKADALREQAATAVYVAPPQAVAAPKVAGLSSRKTYTVEVTDLLELAKAIVAGTVAPNMIQANTTALNQMAVALKEHYNIPGTKLVIGTSLASRAKK